MRIERYVNSPGSKTVVPRVTLVIIGHTSTTVEEEGKISFRETGAFVEESQSSCLVKKQCWYGMGPFRIPNIWIVTLF